MPKPDLKRDRGLPVAENKDKSKSEQHRRKIKEMHELGFKKKSKGTDTELSNYGVV